MAEETQGRFRWLELPGADPSAGETALPEAPKDGSYYLRVGDREFFQGKFEQALIAYSRALRLDRGLVSAWVGQVRCLLELEELDEALVWSEKALESFPKSADLTAAKARVICLRGEEERALEYSDASLTLSGGSEYVWLVRGEILLSLRKKSMGMSCLEKVLEASPQNWASLFQVGGVMLRSGYLPEAYEHLQAALGKAPTNACLWCAIGECQQKLGLRSQARESFLRALELSPALEKARCGLKSAQKPFWKFW